MPIERVRHFSHGVLVPGHERDCLERICARLLVMRDAGARQVDCNYSRYMEIIGEDRAAAERAAARAAAAAKAKAARKPAAQSAAPSKASKAKSQFWKLSVDELEAKIMESETRIAQIQEKFAAPDVYQNRSKLDALNKQLEQLKSDLAELEAEWESRAA